MIMTFMLCWVGMKTKAPVWYYALAVIRLLLLIIEAYRNKKIIKKVNSLWVYKNAPRN